MKDQEWQYLSQQRPEQKDGWFEFCEWASENNIGIDLEDYKAWWDCYKAGYNEGLSHEPTTLT